MSKDISPYRKVSMSIWSDAKVRQLSPLLPSGQSLFFMLLAGPQTTNVPGVQPVGRWAFIEMLEWAPDEFDKAFNEVYQAGFVKVDWSSRFIFVPKAIKHNLPQTLNVVKSWAATWSRVSDCPLKHEAWQTIREALVPLGTSFVDAFEAACPL